MSHSFSSRVIVAPGVLFRLVGDEAVLLNLKTEQYLGLDTVGTRMWTLLTNSMSVQGAYDTLLQQYEVAPERLREDVVEFLEKLLRQGLIEVRATELPTSN